MKFKGEKGQALPMVMIAVVIGALIIPPFLGHTGSSLIGSRNYTQAIHTQYACDSGAEHAIWNLTYGGLAASLPALGDMVSYSLDESINSLGTNVIVSNGYETIAWDNFESGGFTGGGGWLGDWYYEGYPTYCSVTGSGGPYEGSRHLRLVGSTGYVKRSVDLSKEVSAHLRFWAKAYSISSGYEANCLVSDDGIEWAPPVATWNSSNDDNVYHYYDIDLTPYNLSGEFWIAFDANLRNTGDYLYVDKIEIVWPVASYVTIAWDDFESGAVWTGGGGWLDNWTHSGDSLVTTSGTPYEGSYHLRLRSSTGYVRRSVNLSSEASSHLQFWAKAESITRGYEANCLVSDDGIGWDTVATWNSSNDNNGYEYYDIDLTPYNLSSQFWIAFDANLYNVYDLLYVDNIVITGIHGYGITSRAGDRRVKAVVDLGGGSVTVLAWYIK